MRITIPESDYSLAVLDVRNSKLFLYEENMLQLLPLVEGEAESLEFILGKI
ncbi:hypothetical protein JL102_14670 [Fulvivirga sp. 2943]|uniref:Uncharacterized protein n=2 Tax=Fulvivirga sediminis TaxID=2803949 RepID=A0A937FB80_9BACT|nr:hypothetical protein [Fulvivirga sediminis]